MAKKTYDEIVRTTVPEPDGSWRPSPEQVKQAHEGFRALECTSKDERVVIYSDASGGLVGGRVPIGADVGPLRNRLGL